MDHRLIGTEVHTDVAGRLRILSRLPGSEGSAHHSEIFETSSLDSVEESYLIKVWWHDSATTEHKLFIEQRYKTFCRLRFDNHPALHSLPQEYVVVDSRPAFIMKRAAGLQMNDNSRRLTRLPLAVRMNIARNVAIAEDVLQDKSVVHADIRQSNMFFDPESGEVQLIDLDGGGYWGNAPGTSRFSPSDRGIPPYIAPELGADWQPIWIHEKQRVQPDLYALAVLIYQILVDDHQPLPTSRFGPSAPRPLPRWPLPEHLKRFEELGLPDELVIMFRSVFDLERSRTPNGYARPTGAHWAAVLSSCANHLGHAPLHAPSRATTKSPLSTGLEPFIGFRYGSTNQVSTAQSLSVVPNVTGMQLSAATTTLSRAELNPIVEYIEYLNVADGRVVQQSEKPGAQVFRGHAVNLLVSRGPDLVSVPNVIGKDENTALQDIKRARLAVSTVERHSTRWMKALVVGSGGLARGVCSYVVASQDPSPYSKVKPGTKVGLVLNRILG